jgi:hypothetical protein
MLWWCPGPVFWKIGDDRSPHDLHRGQPEKVSGHAVELCLAGIASSGLVSLTNSPSPIPTSSVVSA